MEDKERRKKEEVKERRRRCKRWDILIRPSDGRKWEIAVGGDKGRLVSAA